MKFLIILLLLLSVKLPCSDGEHLLYKLKGTVGGKNITHHHMKWTGRIRVVLNPVSGDADLYISDKTTKPNPDNFELHSATCGQETVDVPAGFKRPVSIGVFGYPLMDISQYELTFSHLNDNDEPDEYERMAAKERYFLPDYELDETGSTPASVSSRSGDPQSKHQKYRESGRGGGSGGGGSSSSNFETWEEEGEGEGEDVESFIWALFIYILKFIFDILL